MGAFCMKLAHCIDEMSLKFEVEISRISFCERIYRRISQNAKSSAHAHTHPFLIHINGKTMRFWENYYSYLSNHTVARARRPSTDCNGGGCICATLPTATKSRLNFPLFLTLFNLILDNLSFR